MADRPRLLPGDTAAIHEACHWFFCLREGERSQAELERWLNSNPRHRRAWQWVTAVQQRFEPAQVPELRQSLLQAQPARRHAIKTMLLIAGTGCAGWGAVHWRLLPGTQYDLASARGEIRHDTLPDGSDIWLDTGSGADIAFDDRLRRLIMGQGRILIQTAKDPSRPLVVDVPAGRITALGTRFSVRQQGKTVQVAVYEGAVRLDNQAAGIPATVLQAGQQARFSPGLPAEMLAAPNETRDTAWTRSLLIAQDLPLETFLDELGRYRHGIIRCDPAVRSLKLVGIYPLNDTNVALDVLMRTLPVRVERPWPLWVSVKAR